MGEVFSAIYKYLWAVFYEWWWLVTVLLFGLDKVLEWVFPRYRAWLKETFLEEVRRRYFWRTLFAFVFLSGFLAWKEENTERLISQEASQKELSKAREKIASLEAQPRIGEEAKAQIEGLTQANQQLQKKMGILEQQTVPRDVADEQRKKLTDALGRIEKLKAQIVEVQDQGAPWHIEDMKRFISVLSLFRGQEVDVEYVARDRNAQSFFNEICFAVEVSGWTIKHPVALSGETWDGIIIEVNDLRAALPAAYELAKLLVQQGIAVVVDQRSGAPKPDGFTIRVGYKPVRRISN